MIASAPAAVHCGVHPGRGSTHAVVPSGPAMPTPVVLQVSCPKCGAQVPGLEPGERKPCPYCKTELAMPRLDPARTETAAPADVVVAPSGGGGCTLAVVLAVVGVITAGAIGAAVWGQHRAEAETARQIDATMDQVRRAQERALDQVNAAQRESQQQVAEAARAQARAACALRAAARCERECRQRPAQCDGCLPRERAACATP
jgi:hypothetical protein